MLFYNFYSRSSVLSGRFFILSRRSLPFSNRFFVVSSICLSFRASHISFRPGLSSLPEFPSLARERFVPSGIRFNRSGNRFKLPLHRGFASELCDAVQWMLQSISLGDFECKTPQAYVFHTQSMHPALHWICLPNYGHVIVAQYDFSGSWFQN